MSTKVLAFLISGSLLWPSLLQATDWPQLQKDAARTGRTPDSVDPSYRARWIWMGPGLTLRSKDSGVAGWTDDLTTRSGYSYPMPASVSFTIAESVQPIVSNNRIFIGTQEGTAYGISTVDGSTLWSTSIPGGTVATAAVSQDGSIVVFVTLSGMVYGLNTASGSMAWNFAAKKSITAAPCVSGTTVYIADHSGTVYALTTAGGAQTWSTRLAAPVLGGIAADANSLYVGAENMVVYALNLSGGGVRVQHQVRGQSFRMQWPVAFNGFVWVQSAPTPVNGSEYIMETVMAQSGSLSQEESNIGLWLQGNSQWTDAGADWKHAYALETNGLTETYTILAGPDNGTGHSPPSFVVDNSDRVLTYFKTRYPTLTAASPIFGTNYSVDIAAVNQGTGNRIPINNGHLSGVWPWETDNLFAMSVAGTTLWLRNNFRGTQTINLANSTAHAVQAQVRNWDGGNFSSYDIIYYDQPEPPNANQDIWEGWVPPVVVGNQAYITENYGVTAIEHKP